MRTIRLLPFRPLWICGGLLVVAACVAALVLSGLWPTGRESASRRPHLARSASKEAAPPLPDAPDIRFMPVSATEAKAINARMALSTAPIEVARPFILPAATSESGLAADRMTVNFVRDKALDCLTAAIYYEAASESPQGQRAVAQVVLNRMRHPAFPKSICGVVYQGSERTTGCQFTFTCDGALARRPSEAGWRRARLVALGALAGVVEPTVGTATHYHTDWVVPYWAPSLDKVAVIGAHIFYRWQGYWGRRSAFAGVYAGEAGAVVPMIMAYDGLEEPGEGGLLADSRIRPLADQVAQALPSQELAVPAGSKLRADENRGALAADQHKLQADMRSAKAEVGTGPRPLADGVGR